MIVLVSQSQPREDAAESLKVLRTTCSGMSGEVKGDARVRSPGRGHSAVMNLVTSERSPRPPGEEASTCEGPPPLLGGCTGPVGWFCKEWQGIVGFSELASSNFSIPDHPPRLVRGLGQNYKSKEGQRPG